MKPVSEPVLLALIAVAGVIIAPTLVVIVQRLTVIHTAVNSRLTTALELNQSLEAEKRQLMEEKYQLREQLALARQLQAATEKLPARP